MAGRRSAPKQCANPLFVQWLGEWYDKVRKQEEREVAVPVALGFQLNNGSFELPQNVPQEREKDTNFRFVLYKVRKRQNSKRREAY